MTTPADRLKAVFDQAAELPDPAERAAFLDRECAGDAALRGRVEALLKAHEAAGSFLANPASHPPTDGAETASHAPRDDSPTAAWAGSPPEAGTVVGGRYKLLEEVGEGGMGTVWMAQQTEPVKRLVAVKLIKAGMDSRSVLARFEAERQALALMDHPNIAKVHDAGATPDGRPYFVMELVKGVPITKYCDEKKLTPRERLELFVPVCQAIQHAHQKGVIHRDIKPNNVLVALYDDKPVPKVIDFGVAKAAGQALTEKTLHTGFGAVVGTVEYMSPEQASFNQLDVDTRSDVYSLGVLLYELLAGSPPFTRRDLEQAGLLEMLRVIREREPSRPSTKLSTADGLPTLAANRGTEPARLTRLVRGELDWIVMRALEKDRGRRYETANGFAADVQRYLAGEAVQAVPPSAGYRLRKFARRNRGPVLAAAVVLLTLVGGIAGTTVGLVRAERARQAEVERADGERRARKEAEDREEETRAMLDFVEHGILVARMVAPNPGMERDDKAMLRRAVGEALPFVDRFKDRPLIEARLRLTLGAAFNSLNEHTLAAQQIERARALYEEHRGPTHPDTLVAIHSLAELYSNLGRLPDTLKLLGEMWERQRDSLGQDHVDTLATRMKLADYYDSANQPADALKLRKEILSLLAERKAPFEPGHSRALTAMTNAPPLQAQTEEGLKLLEQILEIQKSKLAKDHPDTLATMKTVATHYAGLQRDADALKMFQDVLVIQRDKPGRQHPETIGTMLQVANLHIHLKQYEDALKLCQEVLAIQKVKRDPVDSNTLGTMAPTLASLADRFDAVGRPQEALKLREGLLALRESKSPAGYPETLGIMDKVADSYTTLGRHTEALKLREEALKVRKAEFPGEPLDTIVRTKSVYEVVPILRSMTSVADSHAALSRHAEAEAHYGQALELYKALLTRKPEEKEYLPHIRYLAAMTAAKLGAVHLLGTRKLEEAEARLTEAVKLGEHPDVLHRIGIAYARNGQWKKAATAYDRAVWMGRCEHACWYYTAALHLGAGDTEGYRRTCREMIDRFCTGPEIDPVIAERTAKACSLVPGAVADFGVVEKLAQRAVTGTEKHASYRFFVMARGLAEYRAGRHAEAVKWLERFAPKADGTNYDATVFAALAMAHHRLGRAEEAKECLAAARGILVQKMPDPAKGRPFGAIDWHDWLHAEVLTCEAEGLIGAVSPLELLAAPAAIRQRRLAAAREAVRLNPDDPVAHAKLGNLLAEQGEPDEAISAFREVVRIVPDDDSARNQLAVALNNRAWTLATDVDAGKRDPGRAVKLAEEAVKVAPKNENCWNTLGVAHYRAGNFKGAVAALQKFRELRVGDGEWSNPFFLAMAHWRLGNTDEARRWRDKAITWMEAKAPQVESVRRYRAEMEGVMREKSGSNKLEKEPD